MSSPILFIFFQGITISVLFPNEKSLFVPGTIIAVIYPVSTFASTSCTYPSLLPSVKFITSFCLNVSALPNSNSPPYHNYNI